MKKVIALCLTIICILLLAGCGSSGPHTETDRPHIENDGSYTVTDYPAAIMADGEIYLLSATPMPAEPDESAIIGYTSSYTDEFPDKDGETNFNRELNMPYARVSGGIAVLYENEWFLCTLKDK